MAKQDQLAAALRTFYAETIRPDLDRLQTGLAQVRGEMAAGLDQVRAEMAGGLDQVRAEMVSKADLARAHRNMAQMEQRLQSEIQEFRAEFHEFRHNALGHFDSIYHCRIPGDLGRPATHRDGAGSGRAGSRGDQSRGSRPPCPGWRPDA